MYQLRLTRQKKRKASCQQGQVTSSAQQHLATATKTIITQLIVGVAGLTELVVSWHKWKEGREEKGGKWRKMQVSR